jgi:hypothetical protein
MRDELSVLTRLAFARLLAKDGRPAPAILDDALVYSDDDRIEKMFDALHRQAREQQSLSSPAASAHFRNSAGTCCRCQTGRLTSKLEEPPNLPIKENRLWRLPLPRALVIQQRSRRAFVILDVVAHLRTVQWETIAICPPVGGL